MSNGTLDVIFSEVVRRFEREIERTAHLDDKANNIVGFVGILTGLISGFGIFVLKPPTNTIETIIVSLFVLSLAFLISSFVFALKAYFPKKFTMVPDPYFLIGNYEKAERRQVIKDLCDNYAVAVEDNLGMNNSKIKNIKRAIGCIFFATATFSFFALAVTFSH